MLTQHGLGCPVSAALGTAASAAAVRWANHLEKRLADFGISRPHSGVGALLGTAEILGGSWTGVCEASKRSGRADDWQDLKGGRDEVR